MKRPAEKIDWAGIIGFCLVSCTKELITTNRNIASGLKMNMNVWRGNMMSYAGDNPVKFVALSTFTLVGAIPVLAFTAYCVASLVACIIGAVVVEIFLLALGITGLTFVLFFVTCISLCVTSVFGALLFAYQAVSSTMSKTKGMRFRLAPGSTWPYSSSNNSANSETAQSLGGGAGDTNKTK